MAKLKAKQIDALQGQGNWRTNATLPSTGTTLTVTAHFSGETSGGSDSQVGVFTNAPQNKVFIRRAVDGKAIADADGNQVFARLTETGGVWTLTFYVMSAGAEVAFNWAGHADANAGFHYRWCEAVQLANVQPTAVTEIGEAIDEFQIGSPSSHSHVQQTLAVTSNGQTAFNLDQLPKFGEILLIINGQPQKLGASYDFTVDGQSLTWLGRHFQLSTSDEVVAYYEV